jgi:Flp pilus assembly protein TadD
VDSGGDLDAALQLAQTAKRKLPDSPEVNDTLGLIYYRKNLPAMAIPPLKLSVEKDAANPEYQYHLGMAYAKNGDEALARQALQRALASKGFERAADAKALLDSLDGER